MGTCNHPPPSIFLLEIMDTSKPQPSSSQFRLLPSSPQQSFRLCTGHIEKRESWNRMKTKNESWTMQRERGEGKVKGTYSPLCPSTLLPLPFLFCAALSFIGSEYTQWTWEYYLSLDRRGLLSFFRSWHITVTLPFHRGEQAGSPIRLLRTQ